MTIPKNITNTLRYKHLVARYQGLKPYVQEEKLRTEITNGPQWRINATLEAINKTPANWNYINITEVMKHAAMLGRLQTIEKISESLQHEKIDRKLNPHRAAPREVQAAFHVAARHGRYRTADALHKRGGGPMYQSESTPAVIYTAVSEGDLRKIDYLIRRGADKDYLVGIAAASENYMKVTKHLVERKHAKVNPHPNSQDSAFLTAVKYGREDLAEYLLEHGAAPQLDKSGAEAMYTAVDRNNEKLARLLIAIGIKPTHNDLQNALYKGNLSMAKLIVTEGGIAVNSGTPYQNASLMATVIDKPEALKFALENGVKPADALATIKADISMFRYGARDQIISSIETHLLPKTPPAAPTAPQP